VFPLVPAAVPRVQGVVGKAASPRDPVAGDLGRRVLPRLRSSARRGSCALGAFLCFMLAGAGGRSGAVSPAETRGRTWHACCRLKY